MFTFNIVPVETNKGY